MKFEGDKLNFQSSRSGLTHTYIHLLASLLRVDAHGFSIRRTYNTLHNKMADAAVPPRGQLAPCPAAWVRSASVNGGTGLSADELHQFWHQGFVVKRNLFLDANASLQPARDAITTLVDSLARKLLAAGKITSLCEDFPWETRMLEIEKQCPNASVLLHKMGVLPPEIAQLWVSPELTHVAKQLLGDDLAAHPVRYLRPH